MRTRLFVCLFLADTFFLLFFVRAAASLRFLRRAKCECERSWNHAAAAAAEQAAEHYLSSGFLFDYLPLPPASARICVTRVTNERELFARSLANLDPLKRLIYNTHSMLSEQFRSSSSIMISWQPETPVGIVGRHQ